MLWSKMIKNDDKKSPAFKNNLATTLLPQRGPRFYELLR